MYEQLISVNWFTICATLLNTLILFLVLKHFLYLPVKRMLQSREDEVRKTYEEADQSKSEALRLKTEYEQQMATVKDQASEVMRTATRKAQSHADELLAEAQKKAEDRVRRAEQQIAVEKNKAVSEARDQIAGLALTAAERVLLQELDQAKNERLVSDFLNQLELSAPVETPDLSAKK